MRYLFILTLFLTISSCQSVVVNTPTKCGSAVFFSVKDSMDTLEVKVLSSQMESRSLIDLKVHEGKVLRSNGEWKALNKCFLISSSQIGAFKLLNEVDKVQGFNNVAYAYDSEVRSRMVDGRILHIGEISSFNKERIIKLKPDAIFYSAEVNGSSEFKFYESQGILMIPVLEWREESALARAEWIKFYGALLGKKDLADSIFNEVKDAYLSSIPEFKIDKTVMIGNDYQGVWYTPAGDSYVAKLIHDAGADYVFQNTQGNGSLAKDFEVIIQKCGNANYWINPGTATSLGQLKAENSKYELFSSFSQKKVFNSTARRRQDGANDYWETGVYLPHLVLKDYIRIFSGKSDSLYFYQQLK